MKNSMQSVRVHAPGGPQQLVIDTIPRPQPGDREVLIRVHAAGVNPLDWKTRQGTGPMRPAHYPYTPGTDFAGTIAEVGSAVRTFRTGQAVYGQSPSHQGAYAQYVVTPPDSLALKPVNIDFAEAASVPAGALTAWQALFDHGNLQAGQRVLIHAAAGGVGLFAVQLAKRAGAFVFGTASAANESFLRELGVDVVIDYESTPFEQVAHDVDLVIDPVGGDTLDRSWQAVKPAGRLVILGSAPTDNNALQDGADAIKMVMRPSGEQLSLISDLIETGQIKPGVARRLRLSEASLAHRLGERGHGRGRIVLEIARPGTTT